MIYPGLIVAGFAGLLVLWFWHETRGEACACGYARRADCACVIRRIERKFFGSP